MHASGILRSLAPHHGAMVAPMSDILGSILISSVSVYIKILHNLILERIWFLDNCFMQIHVMQMCLTGSNQWLVPKKGVQKKQLTQLPCPQLPRLPLPRPRLLRPLSLEAAARWEGMTPTRSVSSPSNLVASPTTSAQIRQRLSSTLLISYKNN